ncbi:hypothetical protein HK100_011350 [Physocladia obscura]|uniref:Ankyrin repeat protein n=1 Tax=Physocladia obscura TaxID=109957 RepID=A0AAD5T1D8_9FUNG|nr:hypothetical protein HK100_011350 [Physocladia obscura]
MLAKRAITDDFEDIIRILISWELDDSLRTFIFTREIILHAIRVASFSVFELLFLGSSSNPPPWLFFVERSTIEVERSPKIINDIDAIVPLIVTTNKYSQKPIIYAEFLRISASRKDCKFVAKIIEYCSSNAAIYQLILDEAPYSLLLSCEKGHVEVSLMLISLCTLNSIKQDTLRRCVSSGKIELVQMLIDWFDVHTAIRNDSKKNDGLLDSKGLQNESELDDSLVLYESEAETEDSNSEPLNPEALDAEPDLDPAEHTVNEMQNEIKFVCGVSVEIWGRCVELASRDGNLQILDLLFQKTSSNSSEDIDKNFLNLLIPIASLHMAVLNGHTEIVHFLLSHGVIPTRVAFATAISTNKPEILKLLLKTPVSPPAGSVSFAIDSNSFECLELLLKEKSTACEVSATDVLFAARYSSLQEARHVHAHSAAPGVFGRRRAPVITVVINAAPKSAVTEALNMAIHEGNVAIVSLLLGIGAEPTEASFTSAIFLNNKDVLLSLIVNVQMELKMSRMNDTVNDIISGAVESDIAAALLRHETKESLAKNLFQTALTCAIDTQNISLIAVILTSTPAQPTTSDIFIAARNLSSLLSPTAVSNSTKILRFLISEYPHLSSAPLDLAVRQENLPIVATLVTCGAVPTTLTVSAAIESGNLLIIASVLNGLKLTTLLPPFPQHFRLSTNSTNSSKITKTSTRPSKDDLAVILGSAICTGRDDIVETALQSAIFTPTSAHVYLAAKRGMTLAVRMLANYSHRLLTYDDATVIATQTQTPLDLAVREGDLTAVSVMMTAGIPVGPYAIAAAVESGRIELLQALVVNDSSEQGIHGAVPQQVFEETGGSIVPTVVIALAIQNGSVAMLHALLRGFAVKIPPVLLMMGVRTGRIDVVQVLLEFYYDRHVDRDVLEVAFSIDFEIAEVLIAYVLQRNSTI